MLKIHLAGLLNSRKMERIIVVGYAYTGEPEQREAILYLSLLDAKEHMKKFDSSKFFTCFYGFSGLKGNAAWRIFED